jgi:GT2 family glycosyltransferase
MDTTAPRVSVIVPTFNRPQQLRACLAALAALDYPRDRFEVIVVNDGGEPPSDLAAEGQRNFSVRFLSQARRGPAAARNLGASCATGTLLAFTDDDCRPSAAWLRFLTEARAAGGGLVGGHTHVSEPDNVFALTSQLIVDVVYRYYNAVPGEARLLTTNNMLVGSAEFAQLGGFDVTMSTSEDREFCDRWRWHGGRIRYVPEAVVYHSNRQTLGAFWRQHVGYGRGAYLVQKARRQRGDRPYRDAGFHLAAANWLGYPIAQTRGLIRAKVVCLLAVWQVANAAGFLSEAFRLRRRSGQGLYPAGRPAGASSRDVCSHPDQPRYPPSTERSVHR